MISVLRRDGLVITSSATRCRSSAVKVHSQRHIYWSPAVALNGHDTYFIASARQFSWTARRLATVPPQPKESSSSESVPPTIPQPRKHKVELKPGPVKPKGSSESVPLSSSATTSGSNSTSVRVKPAAPSTPHHVDTTAGVIDAAKQDYADASQHGILAPPPEGSSRISSLLHQAKELFKFYFRGLKLIFTNRKRVQAMHERVRLGGPPLTRWETRFIRTCREDLLKLIPFAVIILVIEEIIPLVVIYAPFILPSTCILPSQKERIDAKKRETQRVMVISHTSIFAQLAGQKATEAGVDASLAGLPLRPINGLLGLSTFGPRFVQRNSLNRHLKLISDDDAYLLRESKGAHLTPSERRQALFERGILTDELSEDLWQSRLEWWLNNIEHSAANPAVNPESERIRLVAQSALGRF